MGGNPNRQAEWMRPFYKIRLGKSTPPRKVGKDATKRKKPNANGEGCIGTLLDVGLLNDCMIATRGWQRNPFQRPDVTALCERYRGLYLEATKGG
jgi:hypothetical protein